MKKIKLLNIFGEDRPGVTCEVNRILADFGINVLDIGQAVIHNRLSLGLLLEIPDDVDAEAMQASLERQIESFGLHYRLGDVEENSYQVWVAAHGRPRHIIVLLARKITAKQISALTEVIKNSGLNIDKIDRLSGRVPLGEVQPQSKACVEFSARGMLTDADGFRSSLVELSSQLDVDISYQEDTIFRRHRRLVAFDMDSTLIDAEVIDELARAAGVGEQVAAITERAMQGEIDFTESFSERLALLRGLDESVLSDIAESLRITEGAERLIKTLKMLGYKTAILSGGFDYFGRYLQKKLGIDFVYANELEIENGKVTGRVSGTVVDGQRKAELLKQIADSENISLEQVIAVGDGANDVPMLNIAGLGIAFRAKPIVRHATKQSISTIGLDGILYLLGLSDRHAIE